MLITNSPGVRRAGTVSVPDAIPPLANKENFSTIAGLNLIDSDLNVFTALPNVLSILSCAKLFFISLGKENKVPKSSLYLAIFPP